MGTWTCLWLTGRQTDHHDGSIEILPFYGVGSTVPVFMGKFIGAERGLTGPDVGSLWVAFH